MSYRQTALKHRFKLLLSISHFGKRAGNGPAETVKNLTSNAIQWGYTEDREPPKGSILEVWIQKQEGPAWAVKAAARLLLEMPNYTPQDDQEAQAFALTLAEALPDHSPDRLAELIPQHLKAQVSAELIQEAWKAKKGR